MIKINIVFRLVGGLLIWAKISRALSEQECEDLKTPDNCSYSCGNPTCIERRYEKIEKFCITSLKIHFDQDLIALGLENPDRRTFVSQLIRKFYTTFTAVPENIKYRTGKFPIANPEMGDQAYVKLIQQIYPPSERKKSGNQRCQLSDTYDPRDSPYLDCSDKDPTNECGSDEYFRWKSVKSFNTELEKWTQEGKVFRSFTIPFWIGEDSAPYRHSMIATWVDHLSATLGNAIDRIDRLEQDNEALQKGNQELQNQLNLMNQQRDSQDASRTALLGETRDRINLAESNNQKLLAAFESLKEQLLDVKQYQDSQKEYFIDHFGNGDTGKMEGCKNKKCGDKCTAAGGNPKEVLHCQRDGTCNSDTPGCSIEEENQYNYFSEGIDWLFGPDEAQENEAQDGPKEGDAEFEMYDEFYIEQNASSLNLDGSGVEVIHNTPKSVGEGGRPYRSTRPTRSTVKKITKTIASMGEVAITKGIIQTILRDESEFILGEIEHKLDSSLAMNGGKLLVLIQNSLKKILNSTIAVAKDGFRQEAKKLISEYPIVSNLGKNGPLNFTLEELDQILPQLTSDPRGVLAIVAVVLGIINTLGKLILMVYLCAASRDQKKRRRIRMEMKTRELQN